MKHEHFPSIIVLLVFLVVSISVISFIGGYYAEGNVGGKAVETGCEEEEYCVEWDWFDSRDIVCVDNEFVETKLCVEYVWDPNMKCVSWEYDLKEVCNEWKVEVSWEKECISWDPRYVC